MIYLADGARRLDMPAEALAILRQATNKELSAMSYRAEAPLRELVTRVQKERRRRYGEITLAVGVGIAGTLAAMAIWRYVKRRPASATALGRTT
jgi:hypothetical protein